MIIIAIDYTNFENEFIKVIRKSSDEVQVNKNKRLKYPEVFWHCQCKNCNNYCDTATQNLKKIKSCGCSKFNRLDNKKYVHGYIGTTRNNLKYKVLDYKNGLITIQFINSGYIIQVNSAKLSGGLIKDPYEPSICGVGYLGECKPQNYNQEYTLWKGLIERCYNPKRQDYKNYGAKGVTVCERWKCFSNFIEDIKKIDGYDETKFYNKELDLDKDIKQHDIPIECKCYSLETCQFISKHINRAFISRQKSPNVKIISQKGEYILKTDCPINELAVQLNIKTQYITRILRGEAKTHKGWTFKYR